MSQFPFLQSNADGVLLSVKVQPRASRDELVGVLGEELKIKVTAPPVDAAANEALMAFLAKLLHCPRSSVRIVRGQTSRHKKILLAGLRVDDVASTFERALS